MTNTDTVERLRELRAKATEGPWERLPGMKNAGKEDERAVLAIVRQRKRHETEFQHVALLRHENQYPDAALIAEAINALPALLDAVEALEPFAGYHTAGLTKCSDFSPPGLKVEHFDAATAALATLKAGAA